MLRRDDSELPVRPAALKVTVVYEAWRAHPLAWIHRAEARSLIEELRHAGYAVRAERLHNHAAVNSLVEPPLLRLSDPVMRAAVQALTRSRKAYFGPSDAVMERCYDKYEAHRFAAAHGVDCPKTILADQSGEIPFPLVLKPRRGSDSIGLRTVRAGSIPARFQTDEYIVQRQIRGHELTIAVFGDRAGMPLRIFLREGTPYSFVRKYLLRPAREPLADADLAGRVRRATAKIARIFGVDWAARIDLIHERATDRLWFLECDAAPLVGARSAFAASFEAAGVARGQQLRMLLGKP
jgi:D-alanine-D-alanine ligase-like ATP-grasp enzyme